MTFEDIANIDTLEDADQRTLRDRWFTGEMQAEAPVKRKADVTPKKAGKKAKGPQMEVTKLEKEVRRRTRLLQAPPSPSSPPRDSCPPRPG